MAKWTYTDVYNFRVKLFSNWQYEFERWDKFDYSSLCWVMYQHKNGRGKNDSFNNCIISGVSGSSSKTDLIASAHLVSLSARRSSKILSLP